MYINIFMYRNMHVNMCMYVQMRPMRAKREAVYGMGWLGLVGSLKLYVSFAEYHLFYRSLLQKRPII